MPPRLVIGLGNPGAHYAGTRHNLGFEVVDLLGDQSRARFRNGPGGYLVAELPAEEIVLIRPMTYMNLSGSAVLEASRATGAEPSAMLVVLDDIALPLGTLRLRRGGSDGGHNGLASVIEAFNGAEIPRLRLGIGPERMPPAEMLAEFVLARFEPQERPEADRMVARAAEAVRAWARTGIDNAMNQFNATDREMHGPEN